MSNNDDPAVPGQDDELDAIDQAVASITDAEVEDRLRDVVHRAGYQPRERSCAITDAAVIGTPFPDRPGFLVATCGHPVAEGEWGEGWRACENCPAPLAGVRSGHRSADGRAYLLGALPCCRRPLRP